MILSLLISIIPASRYQKTVIRAKAGHAVTLWRYLLFFSGCPIKSGMTALAY
jgi:hypothetical protein